MRRFVAALKSSRSDFRCAMQFEISHISKKAAPPRYQSCAEPPHSKFITPRCARGDPSLALFEVAQFRGISGGLDDIYARKHDVQRRLTRSASEGRTAIAADPAVDHSAGDGGRSGSRPRRLIAYLARFTPLFIVPGSSCRLRHPLPVPRLHFGLVVQAENVQLQKASARP